MNVRGRLQPVLRLYDHLGIKPASTDPTQSIAVVVEAGPRLRRVAKGEVLEISVVLPVTFATARMFRIVPG